MPTEYKLQTLFEYEIDKTSINLDSSSVEDASTEAKPTLLIETRSLGDGEPGIQSTNCEPSPVSLSVHQFSYPFLFIQR